MNYELSMLEVVSIEDIPKRHYVRMRFVGGEPLNNQDVAFQVDHKCTPREMIEFLRAYANRLEEYFYEQ